MPNRVLNRNSEKPGSVARGPVDNCVSPSNGQHGFSLDGLALFAGRCHLLAAKRPKSGAVWHPRPGPMGWNPVLSDHSATIRRPPLLRGHYEVIQPAHLPRAWSRSLSDERPSARTDGAISEGLMRICDEYVRGNLVQIWRE